MVAAPLGPLQMEQGYLSTVTRSEQFPGEPAVRFYWGRVEAAANGSDPNLTERYRQLFLAAPSLLAACNAIDDTFSDDVDQTYGYLSCHVCRWCGETIALDCVYCARETCPVVQLRAALALATGEVDAR